MQLYNHIFTFVGEGKEKRTETTTKRGYDYPVPENPLTLPPRTKKPESTTSFTTTTTETITETTSKLPPQNTGKFFLETFISSPHSVL